MSTGFLAIIAAVLIITIMFGLLIIWQLGKFQKKALAAKKKRDEYIQALEEEENSREEMETGRVEPDN